MCTCKCVSVYVPDDKKPKAATGHAWTAILLSKDRTKEMRFKKKRQRGSRWRMKQEEKGRIRMERRMRGKKTGRKRGERKDRDERRRGEKKEEKIKQTYNFHYKTATS